MYKLHCADGQDYSFQNIPFWGDTFCGIPDGGVDGCGVFINHRTAVTNLVVFPKTEREEEEKALAKACIGENLFPCLTLNHKGMAERGIAGCADIDDVAGLDGDDLNIVVKIESINKQVVHVIKYPEADCEEISNQKELGPGYKASYFLGQIDCIEVFELEPEDESEVPEDEDEEVIEFIVVGADRKAAS